MAGRGGRGRAKRAQQGHFVQCISMHPQENALRCTLRVQLARLHQSQFSISSRNFRLNLSYNRLFSDRFFFWESCKSSLAQLSFSCYSSYCCFREDRNWHKKINIFLLLFSCIYKLSSSTKVSKRRNLRDFWSSSFCPLALIRQMNILLISAFSDPTSSTNNFYCTFGGETMKMSEFIFCCLSKYGVNLISSSSLFAHLFSELTIFVTFGHFELSPSFHHKLSHILHFRIEFLWRQEKNFPKLQKKANGNISEIPHLDMSRFFAFYIAIN